LLHTAAVHKNARSANVNRPAENRSAASRFNDPVAHGGSYRTSTSAGDPVMYSRPVPVALSNLHCRACIDARTITMPEPG